MNKIEENKYINKRMKNEFIRMNEITNGEIEKVHYLLYIFVIKGTLIGKTIMQFFLSC